MADQNLGAAVMQLRSTLLQLQQEQRAGGRIDTFRRIHQILRMVDQLRLETGSAHPGETEMIASAAAAQRSWWRWLQDLFGANTCQPTDKSGARVNAAG